MHSRFSICIISVITAICALGCTGCSNSQSSNNHNSQRTSTGITLTVIKPDGKPSTHSASGTTTIVETTAPPPETTAPSSSIAPTSPPTVTTTASSAQVPASTATNTVNNGSEAPDAHSPYNPKVVKYSRELLKDLSAYERNHQYAPIKKIIITLNLMQTHLPKTERIRPPTSLAIANQAGYFIMTTILSDQHRHFSAKVLLQNFQPAIQRLEYIVTNYS